MKQVMLFAVLFSMWSVVAAAPMEEAIESDDLRSVYQLLKSGTDVNARYKKGRTALMLTAARGNLPIARALTQHGAEINAKDESGKTAAMYAANDKRHDVLLLLVNAGADLTDVNVSPPPAITMSQVVVDVSRYKMTPEIFKAAATRALLERGWMIASRDPSAVIGTMIKTDIHELKAIYLYKIRVRHEPPFVYIEYLPGYVGQSTAWLRNIEENFVIDAEALSVLNGL